MEKVVIKEVPVEIVKRELVYVPLYSTDSGLIDTSTTLAGAKPKLGGQADEEAKHSADRATDATKNNSPKTKSGENR